MKEITMKKISLFVWLTIPIFFSGSVSANGQIYKEVSSFIESYVETFNQRQSLNEFFHFPNVWLVGDSSSPRILQDSSVPIVDYGKLIETGWHHSTINEISVIMANEERAFATLDFSRMGENGDEIVRSTVMYTIAKEGDKWGIVVAAAISPVAMPD